MNHHDAQWNTPPDGDFARLVEQLSARSAVARDHAQADRDHAPAAGMTPTGRQGTPAHGGAGPERQTAGQWLTRQLRRWLLPPGIPTWRAWIDELARQAAEKQRKQGK